MERSVLHRKERIILTTIDLIDQFGINALSTREIAKREGVTEAAIFKHYPTKNDLLKSVLNHFSQFDHELYQTIKLKPMKGREALVFFIDNYLIYYENYPAITALTQLYDILRYDPDLSDKVNEIILLRSAIIENILEEEFENGVFRPETDVKLLADVIISICQGICLKWRLNGYAFSLRERTLQAINMVLDAFGNK
jgi:AcrR family transcriptional regulator